MKSLIIFDLDGTLAESKSDLDGEMATLLARLLGTVDVAIISGGAWAQFEKQVLAFLPHDERLKRLSLLPTCGTKYYRFDGAWKKLYSEDFTAARKEDNHRRARSGGPEGRRRGGETLGRADRRPRQSSHILGSGSGGALRGKAKVGSRFREAQDNKGDSRASDFHILDPIGRIYVDRRDQAGDRQGL